MVNKMSKQTYTIGDKELPRVTTITKYFDFIPMSWPANEAVDFIEKNFHPDMDTDALAQLYSQARTAHERISAEARELGSLVHEAIRAYLNSETPILSSEIEPMFNAFIEWEKQYEVKAILTEQTVHSTRRGGYAGTLDLLCTLRKPRWHSPKGCVVDFKVSPRIYASAKPQISMYLYAVEEMYDTKIPHGAVLRFDKEKPGKTQFVMYDKGTMQLNFYKCLPLVEAWHVNKRKR